jgi:hypothetical protein
MKMLLGDFIAKLGREDIYKQLRLRVYMTYLMTYSKAKLKRSGDRASPGFKLFWKENSQTNVYVYGLYYMFHLNTF